MLPDGNLDELSLHSGCPVVSGEKYAANACETIRATVVPSAVELNGRAGFWEPTRYSS